MAGSRLSYAELVVSFLELAVAVTIQLITATRHVRMAKLSRPGGLVKYQDGMPISSRIVENLALALFLAFDVLSLSLSDLVS